MRAEEVEIGVPDGRSIRALTNSTPIRSLGGDVESVLVPLQDLSPMEELERLRAKSMGAVRHELRVPLTSIKGSVATVHASAAALDRAGMLQFFRIIEEQADQMHGLVSDLLDTGRIEAGTLSVAPEPVPVARMVDRARNTFLSAGDRNAILIDVPSDLPRVLADKRKRIVHDPTADTTDRVHAKAATTNACTTLTGRVSPLHRRSRVMVHDIGWTGAPASLMRHLATFRPFATAPNSMETIP